MLEKYNIKYGVLLKYEEMALKSYEQNKYRFSKDYILKKCTEASLCPEHEKLLDDFLNFAHKDEDIIKFMWLYYYFQFETCECYLDNLWAGGLDDVPVPEVCEEVYPGMLKSVVYLAASDHLADYLKKKSISERYINDYYENYKRFADMNMVTHNTYGLCRLAPFVYGYAYPFIVGVGRFRFQITHFKDYCEVYEDEEGKRKIVATPIYSYNGKGLRDEDSKFFPTYEIKKGILKAHLFDSIGRLCMKPVEIDLHKNKKVLSKEDLVATIHIPGGGKLSDEIVDSSLAEAKSVLPKFFDKYDIRAIVCQTWFLDTQLRDILPPKSNMIKFQKRFDLVMAADNKNHSLFDHIFNVKPTSLKNLVPKNNFQEIMLRRALNGEKIYWGFGILKETEALYD